MSNRRQILHVALGAEACELTTHLVNLQGLAATPSNHDDELALCDEQVSHSVYQNVLVPRVLFVDEGRNMARRRQESQQNETNSHNNNPSALVSDCWKGGIEILDAQQQQPQDAQTPATDMFDSFFNTASIIATNPHSRYRAQNHLRSNNSKYQSTSRQVNWDDEDDMRDGDDDDEDEDTQQQERAKQAWQSKTLPRIQTELETFWSHNDSTGTDSTIPWFHYLAPPFHPKSLLSLPTMSFEEEFDYYSYTHTMPSWFEEDCLERLRWLLEDCDSCQGIVLASCRQWGSGLATKLLQELEQEVPSASRWMIRMTPSETEATNVTRHGDDSTLAQEETSNAVAVPSWRTHQVQTVRRCLQEGLALAEQSQHAHAILPLSNVVPPIQGSAALEAATLSYRLRTTPSPSAIVALNSYYSGSYGGEFPFGTAPSLSFAEFLTTLKPSNAHLMLELDTLLPSTVFSWDQLKQGTSAERDWRMKQLHETSSKRPPKEGLPGLWMLDTTRNGILSPCSPCSTNRSLHQQFCLSSAMRPASSSTSISEQTLCLMEGMGVRFHPEKSMASVLSQSLSRLTNGGYAAGSYWKSQYHLQPSTTTLAVLGNSTRSFGHLQKTCADMKTVFAPSSKGFYSRDVRNGILPELEDVEHALSLVYNLRDAYHPPEGSELTQEREIHFDE